MTNDSSNSNKTTIFTMLGLLLLLVSTTTNGFTLISPNRSLLVTKTTSNTSQNNVLKMAASPPPPPSTTLTPTTITPVTQTKIALSSTEVTPTATSVTNLPSQQKLSQMATTQQSQPDGVVGVVNNDKNINHNNNNKTPPSPKTTNVAAGAGVTISDIHYDGAVPKTESDEYVVITNNSNSPPLDISGYYIYVATSGTQGPTFYFPKGTLIKSKQSVRIYTNEIHKETGGYSFGSGKAIWSNNGGLGVLKDAKGKKLGEYKYKPSS